MVEEYLTITELAARLKLKPKTVRNKIHAGIFKNGVHYFNPSGMGPRFKWSAIVAWLEHRETGAANNGSTAIPMARGYFLE